MNYCTERRSKECHLTGKLLDLTTSLRISARILAPTKRAIILGIKEPTIFYLLKFDIYILYIYFINSVDATLSSCLPNRHICHMPMQMQLRQTQPSGLPSKSSSLNYYKYEGE